MLTVRVGIQLFIGLFLFASQAVAQDRGPKTSTGSPKQVMWAANSFSKVSIATSLERLHMALYNTKLLPVRPYEGDKSRYVSSILEELGLTPKGILPVGIDSVLCDLNPNVCSRERKPVSQAEIGDPTKHVGGFKPSKGKWSNNSSHDLVVPDLDMLWSIEFKPIEKPAGKSAFEFLDEIGLNCRDRLGIPCEDLIRGLNSHAPSSLTKQVKSKPILPALRVTTTIPISRPAPAVPIWRPQSLRLLERRPTQEIARVLSNAPDSNSAAFAEDRRAVVNNQFTRDLPLLASPSHATQAPVDQRFPVDRGLMLPDALRDNLYNIGIPKPNIAHEDEPHYPQQAQLLRSISHPYKDRGEFPDRLQAPVKIGILDFWLDQNHCDLPPSCRNGQNPSSRMQCIEVPFSVDRTVITTRAATCGEISQQLNKSRDHAVLITGLIVSEINDKGIVGLNPYAKIVFNEINPDKIPGNCHRRTLPSRQPR